MGFVRALGALAFFSAASSLAAASGAEFLLLNIDARSSAQAGALASGSQGLAGALQNPSLLSRMARLEVLLSHQESFGDWSHDHLFAARPFGFGGLALGAQISRIKPFMEYGDLGEPLGEVQAGSQVLWGGWAALLGKSGLGAGLGMKFFRAQLAELSNTGWAFDAGIDWSSPLKALNASLALKNLGEQTSFFRTRDSLPSSLQGSFSLEEAPWEGSSLRLCVQPGLYFDGFRPFEVRLGAELTLFQVLPLRAGLLLSNGGGKASLGLGYDFGFGQLSYAFSSNEDLGPTHSLSLEWTPLPSLE